MKKKEILIIFILAVLVTLLSMFFGDHLCWRGFPCGFYYNSSPQESGLPVVYGIYCLACLFLPVVPQTITVFLRSTKISIGYHSLNAFFFVDLLFWFLVLAIGYQLMKHVRQRFSKKAG